MWRGLFYPARDSSRSIAPPVNRHVHAAARDAAAHRKMHDGGHVSRRPNALRSGPPRAGQGNRQAPLHQAAQDKSSRPASMQAWSGIEKACAPQQEAAGAHAHTTSHACMIAFCAGAGRSAEQW